MQGRWTDNPVFWIRPHFCYLAIFSYGRRCSLMQEWLWHASVSKKHCSVNVNASESNAVDADNYLLFHNDLL